MANDKDKLFEKIYFLWKGEGEKRNQSIDWFCERYHADVEEFSKWYQGINHSVKEVQVAADLGNQRPPNLSLKLQNLPCNIFESSRSQKQG